MLTLVLEERLTHIQILEQVDTQETLLHSQTQTINTHIPFLETLGITQVDISPPTTAQQEMLLQR
jgi:hypothetical protein